MPNSLEPILRALQANRYALNFLHKEIAEHGSGKSHLAAARALRHAELELLREYRQGGGSVKEVRRILDKSDSAESAFPLHTRPPLWTEVLEPAILDMQQEATEAAATFAESGKSFDRWLSWYVTARGYWSVVDACREYLLSHVIRWFQGLLRSS
ncbi:MAG: hypothetical protein AAGN66_08625 [Acidobacteriota bacterium]